MTTPSTPVSFKAIPDLIGDRIVTLLTSYCITSLEGNEDAAPYKASLVRQGLFQENPVKTRIALIVNPSDPADLANEPKRADSIANEGNERMLIEPYEIGGGERKWVRFTIDIKVFLSGTQENRTDARQIGMWVFGRAQQAIRENRALGLTDDFGETALFMLIDKINKYEGGGPPKSHTWEGQIWISALTETTI